MEQQLHQHISIQDEYQYKLDTVGTLINNIYIFFYAVVVQSLCCEVLWQLL